MNDRPFSMIERRQSISIFEMYPGTDTRGNTMRITPEDRELAAELIEAFGISPVQQPALAIILMSHRQLPANEIKPTRGPYGPCDQMNSLTGKPCVLPRGHLVIEGGSTHRDQDDNWFG